MKMKMKSSRGVLEDFKRNKRKIKIENRREKREKKKKNFPLI